MTILALHHGQITIPTDGEDAARAFYCGLLGLTEVEKPAALQSRGGFWLQVGTQEVHVSLEEGVDRRATKAHLAYAVDDLDALERQLVAVNFFVTRDVPLPGMVRCHCRDPFGNRVEFVQVVDHCSH